MDAMMLQIDGTIPDIENFLQTRDSMFPPSTFTKFESRDTCEDPLDFPENAGQEGLQTEVDGTNTGSICKRPK